jgi:hypothetical protein
MYLTSLPFDYTAHLGPGDRVRSKSRRTSGSRVRRGPARDA